MFKKFNRKMKEKAGFTLIELIIVIAILGILALIAVPRFGAVQSGAQASADKATARTIMSAVSMAEAKYSTNTFSTAASINEFLNAPIETTIGAAATMADPVSGTANTWHVSKVSGVYHVFKDGVEITIN